MYHKTFARIQEEIWRLNQLAEQWIVEERSDGCYANFGCANKFLIDNS